MRVVLLYLYIVKKFDPTFPEHKSYSESTNRFIQTYLRHEPMIDHKLVVVNCGAEEPDGTFQGIADEYRTYSGGGFDCGTYQAVAPTLDCDLVVALNTHTYFWRDGWLEPFVTARKHFGHGVYGATASYEHHPHLRTPAIAFTPKVMAGFPSVVDDRQKAAWFEAGPESFTLWAAAKRYPTMLVLEHGVYTMEHWRTPPNIFRRGDQSNCLIKDRHTDIYDAADEPTKRVLEQQADTLVP